MKWYRCPVCRKFAVEHRYLPGFGKCIDCVHRVKEMRAEGYLVTCLSLFYGRTEPIEAFVNRRINR